MKRTPTLLLLLALAVLSACTSQPQQTAYAQSTPPAADTESKPAPEKPDVALLKQLQPNMMVVDGDPIETTTLDELMREHHSPGVSIAVIRNGKIDWARGFGIADVESGRKVTTQTLFQAASISKPVAAAAALSMVQDGLLDLDEDVNLKLKSWKLPTNEFTDQQPVTLRHLLSHTAGINVLGLPGYGPTRRKRVDIGEAALARLAGTYEILPEWSHAVSRHALFPNMGTIELKAKNGRLIADVPEGSGTEGRVEFLPQSEFQVQQRRNGLLMDFIVEDGQVTGFKFREVEAKRVK